MFDIYINVYGHRIHRLARRLSCGDPDLADDLEQEARIAIWRFDPSRATLNEAAIVMRVARDAMLKCRNRERRAHRITGTWRRRPKKQRIPRVTKQHPVPTSRFAPRHPDQAPVSKPLAA
ncbi:MAG TPA: sigma factor [Gemmatimonadaceae bacterium]|jgi:DNA-directed RNA polymerase specialized sigma24 family protein|nr:sigma factor [Gemmatimonadaceae bacterium]